MKNVYIVAKLSRDADDQVQAEYTYFTNNKLARQHVEPFLTYHIEQNDGCEWIHEQSGHVEAWTCPEAPLQIQIVRMPTNPTPPEFKSE